MNIDLFLSPHNEAGLVCDAAFPVPVTGIILDAQTQELTLEFADLRDNFHLNIPMEETHKEKMLFAHRMYVGMLDHGLLTDAFEVPLLYLNDPYGSEFGQTSSFAARRAVTAFEQFMKRCNFAQGLHRDNLGDEDSARSVLRGIDHHALQLTPALLRQMQMAPAARPGHVPQMPGLGGGAVRQARMIRKKDDTQNE